MAALLAVDVGLRTGLALFGDDGRLRWYRSHNMDSPNRLKRALPSLIGDGTSVTHVVAEGGGTLARLWERECVRQGVDFVRVSAEDWRAELLYPREQRSGTGAKRTADGLARRVIDWSGAPRATSLRHDAAEAILIGVWGAVMLDWLASVPSALRR
ncbi:MAG: hypothetical protein ACR2M1_01320 [Gemmatimonadaceae bacterium]